MVLDKIKDAITDIKRGKIIIIVDDELRENEGDFMIAAEHAKPSKINFMIKKGGGLVCVPMEGKRLDQLDIPLMVQMTDNTEITKCQFTLSVDYKKNTTTGISAADRAQTIKALIDEKTQGKDFSKPGHIFPLRAHPGGLLSREGHTEAAVEISKLAGLYPAGVICEVLNEKGDAAKLPELQEFAIKHNIKIISIEDLIKFKKTYKPQVSVKE